MKKIVYTVYCNGVDGREPTKVLYAFYDETERDLVLESDKNKNYYSKGEQIVDIGKTQAQALAKLDEVDRLVLSLSRWPSKEPHPEPSTGTTRGEVRSLAR